MKNLVVLIALMIFLWSCNQPKPEETVQEAVVPEAPAPLAFGDMKRSDLCKEAMTQMSNGNVEGFVSSFADDAIYRFNAGDSLVGKSAITTYWKERRTNVIDKLEFSNFIWLAIDVNESRQGVRTGNWLLSWYKTSATYKSGKSMTQWMHTLYHFNAEGKIDEVIHYLDRAPVNAAAKK